MSLKTRPHSGTRGRLQPLPDSPGFVMLSFHPQPGSSRASAPHIAVGGRSVLRNGGLATSPNRTSRDCNLAAPASLFFQFFPILSLARRSNLSYSSSENEHPIPSPLDYVLLRLSTRIMTARVPLRAADGRCHHNEIVPGRGRLPCLPLHKRRLRRSCQDGKGLLSASAQHDVVQSVRWTQLRHASSSANCRPR